MIKIFRLKNGEDVIGMVDGDYINGQITIEEPMSVGIEMNNGAPGLMMSHWLPVQLLRENKTVIKTEDILLTLEPNDEFIEYYINTVERINEILAQKEFDEEITEEEIEEALDLMEQQEAKIRTLH